jgi:hypothetical protein
MQLAVDARIPRGFKGAGQEAVYIGAWLSSCVSSDVTLLSFFGDIKCLLL